MTYCVMTRWNKYCFIKCDVPRNFGIVIFECKRREEQNCTTYT